VLRLLLVFGTSGQVAREIATVGPPDGWQLRMLSRAEVDVTDHARIARLIADERPHAVINATGYTAVDKAEGEPDAAFAVNRDAPARMAAACAERDIPFLHLSTDYVFDGTKATAYEEADPVAPLNAYGRTKLAGEQAVMTAGGRAVILRTSWVYSPFGTNFVKTMIRLAAEREEVRVVADQRGCPTAAQDLAAALLALVPRLMDNPDPGHCGIFHLAGQGVTTWHDFAQATFAGLARRGRKVPRLVPIGTADYPTPARRPKNSELDCARIVRVHGIHGRPWQQALDSCLDSLVGPIPPAAPTGGE
jgi:dTDP-4-dehydrorhamnose reductase